MRNLLYILVLLISFSSFGQNNKDALRLCSVLQSNSFSSNSAAEDALERILGTIGASKRFVLQPCSNINNAVATSYKGIRYILYDPDFMNTLNYGNNWGNLFILAHEVGHHINGHSLDLVLYAARISICNYWQYHSLIILMPKIQLSNFIKQPKPNYLRFK